MNKEEVTSFFLRVGLATVFGYAALAAFLDPTSWIGFVPSMLGDAGRLLFLYMFGAYELFMALWLLSDRNVYGAAIASSITLFAILVANIGALDILFRDVAILMSSLALLFLSEPMKQRRRKK